MQNAQLSSKKGTNQQPNPTHEHKYSHTQPERQSQAAAPLPRSPAGKLEITLDDEDDLMRGGLFARAHGCLLKDTDRQVLFNTICAAVRGETLLRPEVLIRLLAQTESKSRSVPGAHNLELTSREREILAGLAHGQHSKEIALHLGIK